ncbi:hypothetical protein TYRP_003016 [Tyrophagus putrescentiae]|nr:hypothetical protein TYRP_003016 [Tyrophagus putrescentiae]
MGHLAAAQLEDVQAPLVDGQKVAQLRIEFWPQHPSPLLGHAQRFLLRIEAGKAVGGGGGGGSGNSSGDAHVQAEDGHSTRGVGSSSSACGGQSSGRLIIEARLSGSPSPATCTSTGSRPSIVACACACASSAARQGRTTSSWASPPPSRTVQGRGTAWQAAVSWTAFSFRAKEGTGSQVWLKVQRRPRRSVVWAQSK